MSKNDYTYAVARIRAKELTLFGAAAMEQFLACKTYEDALRFLKDRGWGEQDDPLEAEALLAGEQKKAWALLQEMVDDMSVFSVFRIQDDFHNLKAAIKLVYTDAKLDPARLYVGGGRLEPQTIERAVREKEFSALPGLMASAGDQAFETLVHTGDGQLCDMILDRAALLEMQQAGAKSGSEVMEQYALLTTAAADIKIAVRCGQSGKSIDFIRKVLAPCPTLDVDLLAHAAVNGRDAVAEYLAHTDYADAAGALQASPAAFERWCDNLIIRHIQPQKGNPFTIDPLAAYLLAKENEIKCARVVLSGKRNGMPEDTVRERLRELYV